MSPIFANFVVKKPASPKMQKGLFVFCAVLMVFFMACMGRADMAPINLPVDVQTNMGAFILHFKWPKKIDTDVKIEKNRVHIHFKRPTTLNIYQLRKEASAYLQPINVQETIKDLRLSFKVPPKARVEKLVLDTGLIFVVKTPLAIPPKKTREIKTTPGVKKKGQKSPGPNKADQSKNTAPQAPEDLGPKGLPVTLDFQDGGFFLAFNWDKEVGAAAFNQGLSVWLAFADTSLLDTRNLDALREKYITGYELVKVPKGQILKITFQTPFYAVPKRNGNAWTFEFSKAQTQSAHPLKIDDTIGKNHLLALRVFVKGLEDLRASTLLQAVDAHQDPLYILTFKLPGVALMEGGQYTDFNLIQAQQGLVISPKTDGLKVHMAKNYIEIFHDRGLLLSPTSDRLLQGKRAYVPYFFKFGEWAQPKKTVAEVRGHYMETWLKASGDERNVLRRHLAKFYLARELGSEAVSTLQAMLDENERLADEAEFQVLMGAASYLSEDKGKAQDYFQNISIQGDEEIDLWRALLNSKDKTKNAKGYKAYKKAYRLVQPYPYQLKKDFVFAGVQLALNQKDTELAQVLLDMLDGETLAREDMDTRDFYEGKIEEVAGRHHRAIEVWKKVISGREAPHYDYIETEGQIRARLAILALRIKNKEINLAESIDEYEQLRYAWRGDKYEQEILETLAQLYQKDNNVLQAMLNYRRLESRFHNENIAITARTKMKELFFQAFDKARKDGGMTPMMALSLYKEFGDLIPKGESGLQIVEYIINELLQADLLEDATNLLQTRLLKYLVGEEKIKAILKIANLYVLNKQGPESLKLLNSISLKEFRATKQQDAIVLTRARGLVLMGQLDQALREMEELTTVEAKALRASIYLKQEDWPNARKSLERIIDIQKTDTNVSIDDLLDLASVYVIMNDGAALAHLRSLYQPLIDRSPYKDKFNALFQSADVLTSDPVQYLKTIHDTGAYLDLYKKVKNETAGASK